MAKKPAKTAAPVEDVAEAQAAPAAAADAPEGARAPWPERLAAMSATEIRDLLNSGALGERKTAQARARLAELG